MTDKLISTFDFSKVDAKDDKKEDYLHCDPAPSFGKLTSESILKLDDELKIMITALTKQIAASQDKSWKGIVSLCIKSPFLQPVGDGVSVTDSLIKNSSSTFKIDGSPDDSIAKEVETWFKSKINDPDVLASTKIDSKVLGRIVAQSGATVDTFGGFFSKKESELNTTLDIGVLRYPELDNPYFKIYRIQVSVWSVCRRTLFAQENENGLQLEFNAHKYKARSNVVSALQASARSKAIEFADSLFS